MTFKLYSEYKNNTKEFKLEEPFDFFVFRPLAFIVLKFTNWSFLRPNHFSFFALIVAIMSGLFLSTGTTSGFFYAGAGIFIYSVLDCCDGMLARMNNHGSKYGELIDMFVDLLASISFFRGLYIGLSKTDGLFPIHYQLMASAFFLLLHVSIYNFYKKQFFFYQENNPSGRTGEIEQYKKDFEKLNKENGSYFERLLLWLFFVFSRAQKNPERMPAFKVAEYLKHNRRTLPMWGMVAGSTHLTILSLSLMADRVELYFFFAIVPSNLWLIFVNIVQTRANASMEREK